MDALWTQFTALNQSVTVFGVSLPSKLSAEKVSILAVVSIPATELWEESSGESRYDLATLTFSYAVSEGECRWH